MAKERLIIFDTTERDGEQTPGVAMTTENKVVLARQLEKLGVDVVEAGFPASSSGEMEAVSSVAKAIYRPVVCALARATFQDIDLAWQAIREARNPRIHVFISSSQIHMDHQLKKTPSEVLEMAYAAVERAKSYTKDVEFSAMDATRTPPAFLYKLFETAIRAGATTINVPDTVGYILPDEFARLIRNVLDEKNIRGIRRVIVSVHCHNDLGLATANSLAAIYAGARQVECTINGLGERAGNASLEEIVMSIHTREDCFNVFTEIETRELYRTSQMAQKITGIAVQPNKAIVGGNAFCHQSGIHQDGVIKNRQTYEIINPESVGFPNKKPHLVMGKNSGRAGLRAILKSRGLQLAEEDFNNIFQDLKNSADLGKQISHEYIQSLAEGYLEKIKNR